MSGGARALNASTRALRNAATFFPGVAIPNHSKCMCKLRKKCKIWLRCGSASTAFVAHEPTDQPSEQPVVPRGAGRTVPDPGRDSLLAGGGFLLSRKIEGDALTLLKQRDGAEPEAELNPVCGCIAVHVKTRRMPSSWLPYPMLSDQLRTAFWSRGSGTATSALLCFFQPAAAQLAG